MADVNDLPPNERPATGMPPRMVPSEPDEFRHPYPSYTGGRDVLAGVFWAALLIMAGAIYMADNLGILPTLGRANTWDWVMLGAGSVMLFFSFIQVIMPDLRGISGFWTIAGLALLAIGSRNIFFPDMDIKNWWPLILIFFGLSSLAHTLRR